ncbi:hypothetical protein I4U23_027464 [Adineta vaga]|nr:hypothetical protein I4U23_027464 [Adineta vaga]
MSSVILIFYCLGIVLAKLHHDDIPKFYLDKPYFVNLTNALNGLLTDDNKSGTLVPRRFVIKSLFTAMTIYSQLDINEKGAIALYTTNSPLQRLVNEALRSLNEVALTTWAPYLKLFHIAITRLQPSTVRICRGVNLPLQTWEKHGREDTMIRTLSMSFSSDIEVCKRFAGQGDGLNCTIIWMDSISARSIVEYSFMPSEKEYIILPGTLARIATIKEQQGSICRVIYMEEQKPINLEYEIFWLR